MASTLSPNPSLSLLIPSSLSPHLSAEPTLPYLSPELHGAKLLVGAKLRALVGAAKAARIVSGALILITLGGNDFVNNYFLIPYSLRSRQFTLPDYVRYIISEYKKILVRLYKMGARRVLVTGTGPLGCAPVELALRSHNGESHRT